MTRTEAKALLLEMRKAGTVVKVAFDWAAYKKAHKLGNEYSDSPSTYYYKLHNSDDEYIRGTGAGSWACKNTFADWYAELRFCKLLEKLPATHFVWGL